MCASFRKLIHGTIWPGADLPIYEPKYRKAWALVVGIDAYAHVGRLGCARHDAEGVAQALVDNCGFANENITLLLDEHATGARIREAYLDFAGQHVHPDDKILVFFAGHGCTRRGLRGETGYLLPVDGHPDRLHTLLRWDEFTRHADQIAAKHILFIMDACYGGLAVTRGSGAGELRFLSNLLRRRVRQVLTAGKADQEVADSGGPIDGHSMFTGHFLEAIGGAAKTGDGIITANGVMSHVYTKVSLDPLSDQIPHYGTVDGDGDFIFAAPELRVSEGRDGETDDYLVPLPANAPATEGEMSEPTAVLIKRFLSEPRYRIELDDLAKRLLREALARIEAAGYDHNDKAMDAATVAARIETYELAVADLATLGVLLGRWAEGGQIQLIPRLLTTLADSCDSSGGYLGWIGLGWYPVALFSYYAGIAALSVDNVDVIRAIFRARTIPLHRDEPEYVMKRALGALANGNEVFKKLPGHENQFVPRSEIMFKALQPLLEEHLFLGKDYESLFDRFEVIAALAIADGEDEAPDWAPVGRFAWKASRSATNPLQLIKMEAHAAGTSWPLLKSGLFDRTIARFDIVWNGVNDQVRRMGFH